MEIISIMLLSSITIGFIVCWWLDVFNDVGVVWKRGHHIPAAIFAAIFIVFWPAAIVAEIELNKRKRNRK